MEDAESKPQNISIHALLAESDQRHLNNSNQTHISIHALLAESDGLDYDPIVHIEISIHALLAESDRLCPMCNWRRSLFLSTLSLRRATGVFVVGLAVSRISIHALLAESDQRSQ